MTGVFISMEGVEGVGKSTNHAYVCDYLRRLGHDVVATREPGGTDEAEKIRQLLLDSNNSLDAMSEALLMFAARREHVVNVILPALDQGKSVVTDRFVDASYAYQGGARELGFEVIAALEKLVLGDLKPDLTLLLDLEVEQGLKRLGERDVAPDRIEQEGLDFLMRVRDAYLLRASEDPERVRIVDATGSVADVQQRLQSEMEAFDAIGL